MPAEYRFQRRLLEFGGTIDGDSGPKLLKNGYQHYLHNGWYIRVPGQQLRECSLI